MEWDVVISWHLRGYLSRGTYGVYTWQSRDVSGYYMVHVAIFQSTPRRPRNSHADPVIAAYNP